jgi:hypoxanthine phosphoribosyltransferase
LLDKPDRRRVDLKADYAGFVIPDQFIVGYRIDYAERYRNFPYIATVKEV